MSLFSLGFDFGTESVRVLIVDIKTGNVAAQSVSRYDHGVIDETLPTSNQPLPPDYALQHPQDWLSSAATACKSAIASSKISPDQIVGIGVDFTSCTMLPALRDGTPLCLTPAFSSTPLAWPKLWKHHGAKAETDLINRIAQERKESWLPRYGGTIGLEWFFPKILETLNHAPQVYDAADIFLEAGDWFVWQLTTGPFPHCDLSRLTRSTCQAGYKAMWNSKTGYASEDFFAALHPKLKTVVQDKLRGALSSPGRQAGVLSQRAAQLFDLKEGTPVSTAIIDAHAGVPGAGVAEPSTMVLVMGTSSCHMMNSRVEQLAPGIAGVVEDGILPEYFGYETGQAAVGDAFAWFVDRFKLSHDQLTRDAAQLPPGANGLLAIDWFNGCRTPLMDARLSGAFIGLTLSTTPAQMYRALLEATAFGVRWIVDTLRDSGIPVRRFVASGGLPSKSPLLMQIYTDVLNEPIAVAESDQSVALGAAILGCLAAGPELTGYTAAPQAIQSMARQREDLIYHPNSALSKKYDDLYRIYREVTEPTGTVARAMRRLHNLQ